MNFYKQISQTLIRPVARRYLSSERTYRYGEIRIKILPGVFHPGLFFSTKFLIEEIESEFLYDKTFLELGAGSGLISFVAEKLGAKVTSTDISETAIKGLGLNREIIKSSIEIICSDMFDAMPPQQFDYIVINPPYYRKKAANEAELAWNCGENFEYFEKLFSQVHRFIHEQSRIIMVLSEDCDIFSIEKIAERNRFAIKEIQRKKFWWEWNFIYSISKKQYE